MNLLTNNDLETLIGFQDDLCITIYLPTFRAGVETKQGRIRLKNLIREAEERLINHGLRSSQASQLLEPLKKLTIDDLFWQHQRDGLAIFLSSNIFNYYHLPINLDEFLQVGRRFHLKPLLPLLSGNGLFYVLALSQNAVRLLQCTRSSVNELDLENIPHSMAEALQYDDPEKQLQYHTNTLEGSNRQAAAVFHGHGVGTDDTKDNILRYFRLIDRGLREVLREENSPLFIAGVGFLHSIYREANTYGYLADEGISGNPEELSAENLKTMTWPLAEQYFRQAEQEALNRFGPLKGTGRTTYNISEAAPAAYNGRVETLFIAQGAGQWGSLDPQSHIVSIHPKAEPGDEELFDLTAIQTILNGGKVYVREQDEIPDGQELAALFRY
ncbi:hypothetical protein ASZ90_019669 [hydrocarbon metagenome]|uniref:Uncharacterized protein n=1 Tax=hydrocarbon metagenome TaxID=938273 RepID=A0A0W8E2K0_9ZZZZ